MPGATNLYNFYESIPLTTLDKVEPQNIFCDENIKNEMLLSFFGGWGGIWVSI